MGSQLIARFALIGGRGGAHRLPSGYSNQELIIPVKERSKNRLDKGIRGFQTGVPFCLYEQSRTLIQQGKEMAWPSTEARKKTVSSPNGESGEGGREGKEMKQKVEKERKSKEAGKYPWVYTQ